jgi:hypothetical protein
MRSSPFNFLHLPITASQIQSFYSELLYQTLQLTQFENMFFAKLSRYRHADGKGKRSFTSYSILTSALDGGQWSASRFGRALP